MGDTGEARVLYERYARRLRAIFLRRGLRSHDAEDGVQEVFARLLARITSGAQPIADIEGWLVGTAQHVAADNFRRRAKMTTSAPTEEVATEDHGSDLADLCSLVAREIRTLPEELRAPLTLHYWRGMSYRRIAARLGISVNAVGLRLYRARAALKRRIEGRIVR